jgi:hypothetical protein
MEEIMKKNTKYFLTACITLIISTSVFTKVTDAAEPGSNLDPIVSKSYVDQKIDEIIRLLEIVPKNDQITTDSNDRLTESEKKQIISDIFLQITSYNELNKTTQIPAETTQTPTNFSTYSPVNILSGQILVGYEGTEIIFRSGKSVAYTESQNGVANITTGSELYNNDSIGVNNLLLVPRADGRGVKALSESWFLVRGGYKII